MTMRHGFLAPAGLMRALLRANPIARLAESPENCRNYPAATSNRRLIWGIPVYN